MKHYDFFFCYAVNDAVCAKQLYLELKNAGFSCFIAPNDIDPGTSWPIAITEAIRDSDNILILVSDSAGNSPHVLSEIDYAYKLSRSRAKHIVPIYLNDISNSPELTYYLATYQGFRPDTARENWAKEICDQLVKSLDANKAKAHKYELYSEYARNGLYEQACVTLTEISSLLVKMINWSGEIRNQYQQIMELDECLYTFNLYSVHLFHDEYIKLHHRILELRDIIRENTKGFIRKDSDLCYVCWMIRFSNWRMKLDTYRSMDGTSAYTDTHDYEEARETLTYYIKIYKQADPLSYTAESEEITRYIREKTAFTVRLVTEPLPEQITTAPLSEQNTPQNTPAPSAPNEKLEAIAGYIQEGYRIFEQIGEDEKAAAFIRCLITSYERLRNYCQEIGASDLTAECIRRIADLKEKLQKKQNEESEEHSLAEKGIRALLGYSRPGTGNYDVFLSHRGYDTDIANTVYQFLKTRMKEVFYDAVSLTEELSDTDYKNAIYQALDKSKHFIVIITDMSELAPGYQKHDKDWMQEEMDVFHSELIEGRKKNGNFIILVTDEVYRQIVDANKTNIDLKWRRHSLIRISEFQDQIMGYLK